MTKEEEARIAAEVTKRWEAHTQLPTYKCIDVQNFIGEHLVIHETGGNGSFIIGENVLTVYSGE